MCKTINEDSAETKINLYKMWLTSIHDKVTCTRTVLQISRLVYRHFPSICRREKRPEC